MARRFITELSQEIHDVSGDISGLSEESGFEEETGDDQFGERTVRGKIPMEAMLHKQQTQIDALTDAVQKLTSMLQSIVQKETPVSHSLAQKHELITPTQTPNLTHSCLPLPRSRPPPNPLEREELEPLERKELEPSFRPPPNPLEREELEPLERKELEPSLFQPDISPPNPFHVVPIPPPVLTEINIKKYQDFIAEHKAYKLKGGGQPISQCLSASVCRLLKFYAPPGAKDKSLLDLLQDRLAPKTDQDLFSRLKEVEMQWNNNLDCIHDFNARFLAVLDSGVSLAKQRPTSIAMYSLVPAM
ncbi:hypothetical protein ADUPG1_008318 [Aduncisulcus paluster]|uniref:Uncharacterized protein n=1 Tax=Aduncisulcus paluster TaxID=2918883 RepID=A0ABQ5KRJ0_9EUKA|nr:hypothetical protein ADUPG1_008318 [Aduncisulcus paluster]